MTHRNDSNEPSAPGEAILPSDFISPLSDNLPNAPSMAFSQAEVNAPNMPFTPMGMNAPNMPLAQAALGAPSDPNAAYAPMSVNAAPKTPVFPTFGEYMPFVSPFDPCPPIPVKTYSLQPSLFLGFQPPNLPQFSPYEALKHGTLWPILMSPYPPKP